LNDADLENESRLGFGKCRRAEPKGTESSGSIWDRKEKIWSSRRCGLDREKELKEKSSGEVLPESNKSGLRFASVFDENWSNLIRSRRRESSVKLSANRGFGICQGECDGGEMGFGFETGMLAGGEIGAVYELEFR